MSEPKIPERFFFNVYNRNGTFEFGGPYESHGTSAYNADGSAIAIGVEYHRVLPSPDADYRRKLVLAMADKGWATVAQLFVAVDEIMAELAKRENPVSE
jgi:hypothetical protein